MSHVTTTSPFKRIDGVIYSRVSTDDVELNALESTPIGAVTPAEGNFTDLDVTGSVQSDMDFGGNYALQLQNIQDLASKGAWYWFDGIDDNIEVAYSTKFAGLVDCGFSIVSFVNIQSLPVNEAAIINYSYFVGDTYGLFIGTAGEVNMTIRGATTSKSVSGGVLELNRNYAIVGVYEPDANARLYVNGNMTTDDMSGHGYSETARAIVIGRGGVWGSPGHLNCGTPKNLLFNLLLTDAEADAFTSGAPVPYKYLGASQTNWVVNGGFETDIATPPNQWVNSGNQVGSSIADGTAPEGSNVLEIVSSGVGNNGANNVYSSPAGKTIMRKHYRLQFKAKSISGNTSLHAHRHTDAVILTGDWAEYTQEFVKTESGYTRGAYIWLEGVGVARVDDVRLTQIGCVAQYEQDGICHNQWIDKSGNKLHGEVSGGSPTNLSPSHKEQYPHLTSITEDTAWTDVVPAGYMLDYIVFEGENANAATIDLGTTASTSDVFSQEVIAGDDITVVAINKMFSKTAAQSLYLNDDGAGSWNSASLLATLYMSKVEV